MERLAWTDERLDDMSRRMDVGFERVDRDLRDLRGEMHTGFAELRGEIGQLRTVMYRMGAGILGTLVAMTILHGI